ncbi:hypothetical protein V474_22325 [Novosphingobium barchaimii LL02]|uniref:Uncharacterized protein n=1 Tax=Novosphingobium barchaimii LL02 TaxID=1114963 RepID=A0A0J7XPA4_9SPHN|nr:hypothetical protein [Novosphingobium barchaimii]KMS53454.1 hypothetical protein V474_22325 [Novosphingobium barchaimii LL02]
MARSSTTDWMKLANDSYWLWAESLMVIGMRTSDMMTGKGSERENRLMVSEKVKAGAEVAAMLATSSLTSPEKSAQKAVSHYRRKVTANRKRLSRRKS